MIKQNILLIKEETDFIKDQVMLVSFKYYCIQTMLMEMLKDLKKLKKKWRIK
jgi:hypothetical protein